MLYLLSQDSITPDDFLSVLGWPVLLAVIGCVIFYVAWRVENRLGKAPWKWAAFVPAVIALFIGLMNVIHYSDPFFAADVGTGKKMMIAYWTSFVFPLLALIGLVLFQFFKHKLYVDPDED